MIGLDLIGAGGWHRRRPDCPPLTHCTDPVVGGFDMARLSAGLNGIKRASVADLGALAGKAIAIEQLAIVAANAAHLPGDATRQGLLQRLGGHKAALAASPDQAAPVAGGVLDTVKNDVRAAAADLGSVEEGMAYEKDHAFDLLSDLADSAADLAKGAAGAASTTTWLIRGAVAFVVVVGGALVVREVRR